MNKHILTINSGSSSIKFAIYELKKLELIYQIVVEDIEKIPAMTIKNQSGVVVFAKNLNETGHHTAILEFISWIEKDSDLNIVAIGHRVVHGGSEFSQPIKIKKPNIKQLKKLIPLAPLHQPHNIEAIEIFADFHPNIPQIACFDTAFHRTQPHIIQSYPLPEKYFKDGIIRYGFHGLSYEYICSTLDDNISEIADGRIIIAHLGNGASMCAVKNKQSQATTMGFSPIDGLMMGTRTGNIDAGIILHLIEEKKMTVNQINSLLYKESGLKGVSAISNDIRELIKSDKEKAKFAIDMFCLIAARNLSGLIPTIGGLDAIIFTAGIGEKSAFVREKMCSHLSWLGVKINNKLNNQNELCISDDGSKLKVFVIPTNEELIIAQHTKKFL